MFAERFGFDAKALRRRFGRARNVLPGILLGLAGALASPGPAAAQTSGICDRTLTVQDEIINAASGVSRCQDVTAAHLASITVLNFEDFSLTSWQAGDFAGLSNLETLYLSDNDLTGLPATVFAGLSNLETLYLNDNDLTGLPATVFAGLSNLQRLDLNDNDLTDLPATVFAGLSNLHTLNLYSNDLTDLPATVFAGLSNLQRLDLNDNVLTSLPATVFNGLSNLQRLFLQYNDLTGLPATVFNGLSNLQYVWLERNPLTSLPPGLFTGLTKINLMAFAPAIQVLDVSLERVGSDPLAAGTPVKFTVKIAQGALRDTQVRWRAIARDGLVNNRPTVSGSTQIKAGETDSGEFSVTASRAADNKPPRILVIPDAPRFGQRPFPDKPSITGLRYSVPRAVMLDFGAAPSASDRVTVYVGNVEAEEGNDVVFPVRLSEAVASNVTLSWNTADGSAGGTGNSADYTPNSGSLTIAAGDTEGTITVSTVEDLISEPAETFYVELSAPSLPAGVVLATDRASGTIGNDDAEITLTDFEMSEGDSLRLIVRLSHPLVTRLAFGVEAVYGTGANAADAEDLSGDWSSFVHQAGPGSYGTTTYGSLRAAFDLETEPDETFTLRFKAPPNGFPAGQGAAYKNGKNTTTVTIKDVAPAVVSIADAAAAEGDDVRIALTLSKALGIDAYIVWYTEGGTATSSDYRRRYRRELAIPAGQTAVPLVVHTREDANPEPDETFTVVIARSSSRSLIFGASRATGTIRNDDARVSLADAAAEEGEAIEFTVTLSHPVAADATLDWQTGDDTTVGADAALSADDPNTGDKADYTPVSNGSLTIPAGDSSATFTVQTAEDVDKEQDETFIVTLSVPGGGVPSGASLTLADNQATGTIRNDDTPSLSVSDASAEEGSDLTFTVTLGIVWPADVTVDWSLQDDTATAPADYPSNQSGSVVIAAGARTATFTVQTAEDTLAEGDETFKAAIAAPAGGFPPAVTLPDTAVTISDAEGVGTITDNDTATVTIADGQASEGTDVEFTVRLSTAASSDLVLSWATTDGTGANAALSTGASPDYTAERNGSLTIPAGETRATIRVPALVDSTVEDPETFTVEVRAPAGGLPSWAALGETVATGTITDDTTPPTVTFAPADGETVGDANTAVTLTFSEPVRQADDSAIDAAAAAAAVTLVRVGDAGATDLATPATVTWDASTRRITIDPARALTSGARYTATLRANAVEDAQGNGIGTDQTATFTVDADAPTVTFAPADGDTAGPGVTVTATFSEAVRNLDDSVLTDSNAHGLVSLKKDGTGPDLAVSGRVTVDAGKTVITIAPASPLPAGRYTVTVLANAVEDEQGNAVPAASATFTVDADAPTVTFAPADGETVGDANTAVTLTFSEPVRQADDSAIDAAAAAAAVTLVRVGDAGATDLATPATVTWDASTRRITIDPARALTSGARYTATLRANAVEDAQGNGIGTDQTATFTVDADAPTVTFAPADGETAGPGATVTATFSEAVRNLDDSVLTDSNAHGLVSLQKDGTGPDLAVSGRVTVDAGKTVITIDPQNALTAGRYTVTVLANAVEDAYDNAVALASATFTVDAAAPTVVFNPAHGDTAGPGVTVTATFNEAIRNLDDSEIADGNAHAAVSLQKDGTGPDLAVSGRVTVDAGKTVITIAPASPLPAGRYTVTVLANAVEDAYDNAVALASATFTVDAAAPTVTFNPAHGDTAGPGVTVTATFSEAVRNLDDSVLTDSNAHGLVSLKKDGTGPDLAVSGRVTVNGGKTVITIDPQNALTAGRYTVTVLANAVEDEQGNPLSAEQSAVFEVDDDTEGVTVTPTALTIAEGQSASYTVVLTARPSADVTVSAVSDDTGAATVDPSSLTFTQSNWDRAQTVTVTARLNGSATISHAASGGGYDDVRVDDVTVTVNTRSPDGPALTNVRADPDTITVGEKSTLSWTPREDVEAVVVSAGDEELATVFTATATSYEVRPTETTTYTVSAQDSEGAPLGDFPVTVTVLPRPPTNGTPTVSASCDPCDVAPGDEVTLRATASDPDGDPLTYAWSAPQGSFSGATDGATARWTAPAQTGRVTIRVQVADGRGGTASADVAVEVTNRAPTVSASCDPCDVAPGDEVTLRATASDPDGDPLTYAWSAPQGSFSGATDGATARWTAPAQTGRVTIRVQVADGRGGTASADVAVEVTNRAPTVSASCDPCDVAPGDEVTLSATASDPDGDPLTYAWSAPQGSFSGATDGATARWTAPAQTGRVTIRVQVADGRGGTASADVAVEVTNRAPTVSASCDPCDVAPGDEVTLSATASDPDGDPLTYAWSAPQGSFSGATDGATARWTAPAQTGRVTIRVQVADGRGGTASADVAVEVTNRAPTVSASCDPCDVAPGDEVTLSATASDPDGDPLTYAWSAPQGSFSGATDGATARWTAPARPRSPSTRRTGTRRGRASR